MPEVLRGQGEMKLGSVWVEPTQEAHLLHYNGRHQETALQIRVV